MENIEASESRRRLPSPRILRFDPLMSIPKTAIRGDGDATKLHSIGLLFFAFFRQCPRSRACDFGGTRDRVITAYGGKFASKFDVIKTELNMSIGRCSRSNNLAELERYVMSKKEYDFEAMIFLYCIEGKTNDIWIGCFELRCARLIARRAQWMNSRCLTMGKLKRLSDVGNDRFGPTETPFQGTLSPVFQPILDLRSGRVEAFEALARLTVDGQMIGPDTFVPKLGPDLKVKLFSRMLDGAIAQLSSLPDAVSVSINVEASVLILDEFYDLLTFAIASAAVAPRRVTLEILEGEAIENMEALLATLARLRTLGVVISLDDIGSGYSSLMLVKDLPVDLVKLDRSFLANVTHRPEDLLFVRHLQSLSSSLGKRLIVEGVETADMLDAMKALGVVSVQGYAIARPMPADAVAGWLQRFRFDPDWDAPASLLGAYAFHLNLVETCRTLQTQSLPIAWKPEARNPHCCPVGIFFDRAGLHDTAFGVAHKRFHDVLPDDESGPDWMAGAARLKEALHEALQDEADARSVAETTRRRDGTGSR